MLQEASQQELRSNAMSRDRETNTRWVKCFFWPKSPTSLSGLKKNWSRRRVIVFHWSSVLQHWLPLVLVMREIHWFWFGCFALSMSQHVSACLSMSQHDLTPASLRDLNFGQLSTCQLDLLIQALKEIEALKVELCNRTHSEFPLSNLKPRSTVQLGSFRFGWFCSVC